jgi:dihydrolipoamide dehydrogenase
VVGSGAIGVEFACFYRALGAQVTIVEVLDRILPLEDAEISRSAHGRFEKAGIRIIADARVARADILADKRVTATLETSQGREELTVDHVIVAAGVTANISGFGLEAIGVRVERGCIAVDGFGRTDVAGVYAIGDVAGGPMLAHRAEHEGGHCVEAISGIARESFSRDRVPACTYSQPQIASVGLTEARAREAGHEIRVGRFPFFGNGKAIALGDDKGMAKVIFEAKSGKLLGAHLVGPEVTELVQGLALAMNLETTEQELIHTIFPHPTLSEAIHESVLDAFGRAIHK